MININLINVIQEIKKQIKNLEDKKKKEMKKIEDKYDKEIKDLETALEVNIKMNTICLECEGKKFVKVYGGYEDRGESETCGRCKGTGIEPKFT